MTDILSVVVATLVMTCWWVFAILFLIRKRPPKGSPAKRDPASLIEVVLVAVGYALVWFVHRPMFTPLCDCGLLADWMVAIAAILLSIGSVWLVLSALRALGRQWSVAAQLVKDHHLVTDGAYSIVRHPIYTGMLGMMIATGLAYSVPVWIVIGGLVGWYGTHLRIQSEEALLKEAFGGSYEEYARRVPALIPGINWIR